VAGASRSGTGFSGGYVVPGDIGDRSPCSAALPRRERDTGQAMSQENLDLLRRGFEYVVRTGELLPETVHPDFVWDTTTFSSVGLNLKKCVGLDEANRWLAEWGEGFENWSLDVEDVFDAGEQVVTFVRQHATSRLGGPEVEMRFAQVWTFRDGRIARMEMYADRDEALEAAGLRE
jgi:ketosteroid isomerase-like protein